VAASTTELAKLNATILDIVTRINSQYSTLTHQPIMFLKQDMEDAQFVAMVTAADVLMITSLREGMNLTGHEYIFCQDGLYGKKKHGALILSEFTGSAAILSNSHLSVNRWNLRECAEAIHAALTMDPNEKKQRWSDLYGSVMRHTADRWLNTYLDHLKRVWEKHSRQHIVAVSRLSVANVSKKYKRANCRLFMLNYEGTLAALETPTRSPSHTPQRTIEALTVIAYNFRNVVYVMSSKKPNNLNNLFRRLPHFGVVAENGCFMKRVGEDCWSEAANMDKMNAWKQSIRKILVYYQERTHGSWVEERYCSLVYHWGEAKDLVGAARMAGDCANYINDACHNLGVHAVPYEGGLLIESTEWNRGMAAMRIFEDLRRRLSKKTVTTATKNETEEDAGNATKVPVKPVELEFLFVAGNTREDECIYR
ncbi:hypothetical protein MMC13_002073, partial [Lambiella insularis]|nr:hypothetical protein [Lambiella insularis]